MTIVWVCRGRWDTEADEGVGKTVAEGGGDGRWPAVADAGRLTQAVVEEVRDEW